MADYKLIPGGITHIPTGANIPANPLNRSWRKYQAWLAEGNTPDPADPPPTPPTAAENATRELDGAAMAALMRKLAKDAGVTEETFRDAVIAEAKEKT